MWIVVLLAEPQRSDDNKSPDYLSFELSDGAWHRVFSPPLALRFMALRILQELDFLDIGYDYANDWIYAEWHGEITFERAKAGGEAVLHFVEAEHGRKLLNDNSRVTEMWLETPEWRAMNVFPRLHAAGLQYVAWVYSPDLYSRFSADRSLEAITQPVALPFEDLEMAKSWLRIV
jgi:hypothetical protein